jgi:ketosteroid isomerase-like protein
MSEENVEALKRALSAPIDKPEDFLAILDEEIVWDPGDFPGGKVYGRDAVREFFRQWIGAFDDFRYEADEYIDEGNAVFVHMRQWGRGKGSGATTETEFWQVWLFFEGKVVRFVQKPNRREALEAAGLSE